MKMLYIIGEPGSGKTTLARRMVRGLESEHHKIPYVTWTSYPPSRVIQIGHDRDTFGGTDALGMAAQKHVLEWLYTTPAPFVLAEGDRLANAKFFESCREAAIDVDVWLMDCPPELLDERRNKRNAEIGKAQDARWLAGRASKVRNLWDTYGSEDHRLDAREGLSELLRSISTSPVGRQLKKARQRARAQYH